ncbi:MAG: DUF4375 domain-containing protein [Roseovarius sp.]
MKSILAALATLAVLATPLIAQDRPACPTPGAVVYPLDEVIEKTGLALEFNFTDDTYPDFGTPAHVAQVRRNVLANLEGKSQAERDALLLGRLSWSTIGTIPLLGITTMPDAGQFDDYLDVLTRNGMDQHATALRLTRDAFPNWNSSAQNRYRQWNDPQTGINAGLDAVLKEQSSALRLAQPPLLRAAQDILRPDPAFDSYLAQRDAADDWQKHTHMMAEIGACIGVYRTPEQADEVLREIDPTLADFHVVDLFLLEAGNGGMHQYIFNSTGMLAPHLADVLTRWELPDQAQAVRDTMAHFPQPYPRDTQERRAVMATFDNPKDDAVNLGTWISDDPQVWEKIRQVATKTGYWPQ